MQLTRIFDLLPRYAEQFGDKPDVVAAKENGQWRGYSLTEYRRAADEISYALIKLGVQPGDRIASISNNRPEWNFLDIGMMQVGAIHIPIYPTISEDEYRYILTHAEVKYVFISSDEIYRRISPVVAEVPFIQEVFRFTSHTGLRTLNDLREIGRNHPDPDELEKRKTAITTDDVATIIYTSGTTGKPKGVMLTHQNMISNFKAVSYIPTFGVEGRALSFLPLCHVYERTINYMYHYLGISIYYAENIGTIGENIKEINPDMMCAVPRVIEKLFDKIMSAGHKLKGVKRSVFYWAVNLADHYDPTGHNSTWYLFRLHIADKLVLSKWRQALGGKFKIVVSGGAAITPRLIRIFRAAGIPIYEGYGLTETAPIIATTSSDPNGFKVGTVGPPVKNTQVRIADDGEILVKGPQVMKGYYNEPELTRLAIDEEGWFHTGDVGVIEPEGQLRITGRKKEIFKTSLGKYISPEAVENIIITSPVVDNVIVLGENQRFAAALIVPDFEKVKSWCKGKGIKVNTKEEMIERAEVNKLFRHEIDKKNRKLGKTEQIRKFCLLSDEWTVLSGELTPTLKLRRSVVMEKYKETIEKLFNSKGNKLKKHKTEALVTNSTH
ncbi:MAG: long-chain fatty acid--CoA ligase [Bacteroidota bacterium]|nr:long-chain fatty acid--CoA ligase [Bacteroidota bacterium]